MSIVIMILKLNLRTLFLTNLWIVFGSCGNILQHPEIREHYLKTRRNVSTDIIDSITKMSYRVEVLTQCLTFTDKIMFRFVETGEPMNKGGVETKDIITKKEVMNYFKSHFHVLNEINLKVPGIEGDVQVFQCAEKVDKIIYIETIKYFDIFIFEKSKINNDIKVWMAIFPIIPRWNIKQPLLDILEYNSGRGNRNVKHSIRVKNNENDFINGLLDEYSKIQPNNEICEVKNFDLVRLCASLFYYFKTWNTGKFVKEIPLLYEIRRPRDDITCITLPITLISSDYRLLPHEEIEGQKIIRVKASPCAINSEWSEPNFYVRVDNRKLRPLFYIIEKIKGNNYVIMKLKNSKSTYDAFEKRESERLEDAADAE